MQCERTKWYLSLYQTNCFGRLKIPIEASIQCWQKKNPVLLEEMWCWCAPSITSYLQHSDNCDNSAGPVDVACVGEMVVSCCYANVNALIQNILDGQRKNIIMAAGSELVGNFSLSNFSVLHRDVCPKAGWASGTKVTHEGFNTKYNPASRRLAAGEIMSGVAATVPCSLSIIPSETGRLRTAILALCLREGLLCSGDVHALPPRNKRPL